MIIILNKSGYFSKMGLTVNKIFSSLSAVSEDLID